MELRRSPVAVVAMSAVAVLAVGIGITFMIRDDAPVGLVRAASLEQLAARSVIYVPPARAFLVHHSDGPLALYARSPHPGGRVRYCASSGWFQDPHGATFDSQGRYVLGPADRGLDQFPIEIRGGDIYIDTNEIVLGPPRGERELEPAGPLCSTD